MTKPDFFIVGAQRCGTTALHTYLRAHPQVYMPTRKELHFFGSDLDYTNAASHVASEVEYLSMFEGATHEKRVGEASPFYLYSKTAAAEIRAFRPDARIIIMLRNPIDFMCSLHRERVFYGAFEPAQEPIHDFRAALAAEGGDGRPWYLDYRDMASFSGQVKRFMDTFPAGAVHVIVFDDLRRDPAAVYRRTCEFLEVDPSFEPAFPVVNANKEARIRLLVRLLARPPRAAVTVGKRVAPRPVRRRLVRGLWRLGMRAGAAPPLDPGLVRRLRLEFAGEVGRLGLLIGRDLSHWSAAEPMVRP